MIKVCRCSLPWKDLWKIGVIPYNNKRKWIANNKRKETGQRDELLYVVCAKLDNYHCHRHQLPLLVCKYLHMVFLH